MKPAQQKIDRTSSLVLEFKSSENVPLHRHRAILDRIHEGYALANADGRLLTVNLALAQMLGCGSREEALLLNLQRDIFVNPYERIFLIKEAREKGSATLSVSWQRRDHSAFEVMLSVYRVIKDSGTSESFEIIAEDLTERKNLETQLMHLQRLQSLGQLASGMAHDINNMLTVIYGSASLLSFELKSQNQLLPQVDRIATACKSAAELTKNILSFGRQKQKQVQNMSVNVVAESVHRMVGSLLPRTVKVELNTDPSAASTLIEPTELEQVLVNLCINARDAMPKGGTLGIATANAEVCDPRSPQFPWAVGGRYVVLKVNDTGSGMSDEVKSKIFEPFFTTKSIGKGSGLGMSLAYNVIKEHRGFIRIDSTPGKGTAISLFLPAETL